MSNILNLISMSKKAGRLEAGEEPTASAARSRDAKLILVAQDASDNTYRRVRHMGQGGYVTWVSVPYTKAELGHAIGRTSIAMLAITDTGLATAIIRGLAQDNPEKYAIPLEKLNEMNSRAQQRQKEMRQHEKNVRTGKYQAKQKMRLQTASGNSEHRTAPDSGKEKSVPRSSDGSRKSREQHPGKTGSKRKKYQAGGSSRYNHYGPAGEPRPGHHKSRES